MIEGGDELQKLIREAAGGDPTAMGALFEHFRTRLKKMVRVRLSQRLRGRVDDSDVIQDAYVEATRRLPEYLEDPRAPFFLWLRQITNQKLIDVHRQHLGAQARDARLEITLHRGRMPMASSVSLAAQLLGQLTSPTQAAARAETRLALQEALAQMDPIDREILALRVYEDMTNQEAAQELSIEEKTASKRYVRALQRLQAILAELGLVG
jgi:RNA polymerase sigma-70 factor (ECF subfamily)